MRRKQQQCGGEHSCAARDKSSQPFALRTVAYLVVVLCADHMRWRRNSAGAGAAGASAPELKWLALKNKSFIQRADNLPGISKILIVALALSGKESMDRVMKVVTPDRVKPIASAAARANDPLVIFVGLRDHANFASNFLRQRGNALFDLGEYMRCRIVLDGLHCVQAQAIEMIFANPVAGVFHHILANSRVAGLIVIDGVSPRCFVAVGGIRAGQRAGNVPLARMGIN